MSSVFKVWQVKTCQFGTLLGLLCSSPFLWRFSHFFHLMWLDLTLTRHFTKSELKIKVIFLLKNQFQEMPFWQWFRPFLLSLLRHTFVFCLHLGQNITVETLSYQGGWMILFSTAARAAPSKFVVFHKGKLYQMTTIILLPLII